MAPRTSSQRPEDRKYKSEKPPRESKYPGYYNLPTNAPHARKYICKEDKNCGQEFQLENDLRIHKFGHTANRGSLGYKHACDKCTFKAKEDHVFLQHQRIAHKYTNADSSRKEKDAIKSNKEYKESKSERHSSRDKDAKTEQSTDSKAKPHVSRRKNNASTKSSRPRWKY